MCMEAESVRTGRTEVGDGCDVWVGKEAVTGSVAETGVLCWAHAERKETRVVMANRLEVRR
jgi:hypothetical protein